MQCSPAGLQQVHSPHPACKARRPPAAASLAVDPFCAAAQQPVCQVAPYSPRLLDCLVSRPQPGVRSRRVVLLLQTVS